MAFSASFTGYGLLLETGDGATPTENFTAITEVKNVDLSGDKIDTADVTHAQSPNQAKEFKATLIDEGEITFTGNWLPKDPTHINLLAVKNGLKAINWKFILPLSLGTANFNGILVSFNRKVEHDKPSTYTAKIRVNGLIAWS